MTIPMNSLCMRCFFDKRFDLVRSLGDDAQATEMSKRIMQMYLDSPETIDSATLGALVDEEIYKYFSIDPDQMKAEKEQSNQFVMDRLPQIAALVEAQKDPVYAALQFAALGNYLDFAALKGKVSFSQLEDMLQNALTMDLDKEAYRQFCADLEKGTRLLYITDNAGEIAFDRICAETLQKAYPHLQITFMVRGGVIHNDATREDAEIVGIPFPVIDNGTAIGGTDLSRISKEAMDALNAADVIIAKGMGNTETLYGCGKNVYYAFLIKCPRFVQFFDKPMFTPLFLSELKPLNSKP